MSIMQRISPPAEVVQKAHAQFKQCLEQEFKAQVARRQEHQQDMKPMLNALARFLEQDPDFEAASDQLRQKFLGRSKKEEPLSPVIDQPVPQLATESVDITSVAPYDYQFTWNARSGDGRIWEFIADKASGQIKFYIESVEGGSVDCLMALGKFFKVDQPNGLLFVSANPSIEYAYSCSGSFFSSRHTHAHLGIYIGEYTLGGAFVRAVVDQRIQLWDLTSDSDNIFSGTNSAYPLNVSTPVDNSHFYEVWVQAQAGCWCTGGVAGAELTVNVPSISLHMF